VADTAVTLAVTGRPSAYNSARCRRLISQTFLGVGDMHLSATLFESETKVTDVFLVLATKVRECEQRVRV